MRAPAGASRPPPGATGGRSETDRLPDQDTIDTAGQFLVDLEDLGAGYNGAFGRALAARFLADDLDLAQFAEVEVPLFLDTLASRFEFVVLSNEHIMVN